MATTGASSGGGGGGSGGGGAAGFLFGNIDRRGRLDEEYLSDDAKDNIDNVGESFTERYQELAQVRRELGATKGGSPDSDSEDDYDDPNDERVDYSNEKDLLEDEEEEKSRMAKIALAPSKRVENDDEDYDDDDDDEPVKNIDSKPATPEITPKELSNPSLPSAATPTTPKSVSQKRTIDEAEAMQRRFFEDAKKNVLQPEQKPQTNLIEDDESDPIKFSEIFDVPRPKLQDKDFDYANVRVHGVKVEGDVPNTETVEDDLDALMTPAPAPKSNPDAYFIEWDRLNVEAAKAAAKKELTDKDVVMKENNEAHHESDDDGDALPMDPTAEPLKVVPECAHDPIMQVAWEDDILFNDDWSAPEDSDGDMLLDPPAESLKASAPRISAAKPSPLKTPPAPPASTSMPVDDDDSDDDDMEWVDGAITKPDSTLPIPAKPPAPVIKPSIPVSKPPPSGPLKAPSSLQSSLSAHNLTPLGRSASALRSVPLTSTLKPPILKSKPIVPLSKPAVPPNKSSGKKPAAGKSSIPLSKPIVSKPGSKKPSTGKESKAGDSKKGKGGKGKGKGKKANGEAGKGKKVKNVADAKKKVNFDDTPIKEPPPPVPEAPKVPEKIPSQFVQQILCPNKALADGSWADHIMWDSAGSGDDGERIREEREKIFSELILNPDDPNLIFETPRIASPKSITMKADQDLRHISRLPHTDPFNISNDYYYSSGTTTNTLKVDRRSLLRGLNNAPPANKCQTTKGSHTDEALLRWHKPRIGSEFITSHPVELQSIRRKRPKGGSAQIAGQIPKKRSELFCSSKDAYRVSLFEYSIEKQPCVLGIPGTASRILTYDRKTSSAEAAQALKNAAGTPDADTVFMAPEEPPPLHAGDIPADAPPLSTVESHLFSAPCARVDVPDTDFLVMRKGSKSFVREIDSIVSLGVTEPKVEVMAPNTDRFKKYGKERVSLFIIREFMKQQKKDHGDGQRIIPSIDKDLIFKEFQRKRTYPETAIVKQLKELAKYQNGRYILSAEPSKGFTNRENEILRTVTAEETAAFEAMEAGWETLSNLGIHIFTHPTSQGNLTQASERVLTMAKAAPIVSAYIKHHLLQSPWYKTQVVIQAQKAQKKDMVQALTLARIVKDLREGGSVMESRMLSLSAGDLQRVLINHFRILARKVPDDVEERRNMVREYAMKKNKSSEVQEYPKIIEDILEKHRSNGSRTGPTANNAATHAAMHVIPLEIQRSALEEGDVSKLKTETERMDAVAVYEACSKPIPGLAGIKRMRETSAPNGKSGAVNGKPLVKKPKTVKKKPAVSQNGGTGNAKKSSKVEEPSELEALRKLEKSSVMGPPPSTARPKPPKPPTVQVKPPKPSKNGHPPIGPVVPISLIARGIGASRSKPGSSSKKASPIPLPVSDRITKPAKRLPSSLKITKNITNDDGTKGKKTYRVTDPVEIMKILENKKKKEEAKKAEEAKKETVKVSISLDQLNAKPAAKKKPAAEPEKPKPPAASKKRPRESNDPSTSGSIRKVSNDKGIGKIRINTKHLKKEREEAMQKRLKAQYGDEDYRMNRKSSKSGMTSRKKQNGQVQLNNILEGIEKTVRGTQGYIVAGVSPLRIARHKEGVPLPPNAILNNLATPRNTALDLTQPVNVKAVPLYGQLIKKPIDLGMIRHKCKKMQYTKSSEFLDDLKLMLTNAKLFNKTPDVQWVVQHCEHLLDVGKEEVEKKIDDIKAAEDHIVRAKSKVKNEGKERRK